MPVDERCRSGDPNIPTIVNEIVVERLAESELPSRCQIVTVAQICVQISAVAILLMKETRRNLSLAFAPSVGAAITVPAPNSDTINAAVANNPATFRMRSYLHIFCSASFTPPHRNGTLPFQLPTGYYACGKITSIFF